MTTSMYEASPRKIREFVLDCLFAGRVPFIKSSPGMGKSAIVKSIAKELNLHVIDHRLSTSAPEDMSGLPRFIDDRATFVPFDLFPVEGTPIPEGKDGWLLFLDEFNSSPKSVQAAAYKLILDEMVGQHKLHERVVIVCAGNKATDRAIVNEIGNAMKSRVITLNMRIDHQEWLEDVAIAEDYDPRVVAFLNYMPKYLMDFKPDHNEDTFCCPRTWEFMNSLVKGRPITDSKTPLYAGTITSGVAVEFVQFVAVSSNIPTIKEILADPDNCLVPLDPPARWYVTSHLMGQVSNDNFENISTYINRMPLDFRVLFFRSTLIRHSELRTHPAFARAMGEVSRYLNAA